MSIGKNSRPKKSARGVWPVTQKWIAMGTFVVYTAIGSKIVTVALAQEIPDVSRPGTGPGPAWSLTVRRFDIPAGPVSEVVDAFRNATHLLVVTKESGLGGSIVPPGVFRTLYSRTGPAAFFGRDRFVLSFHAGGRGHNRTARAGHDGTSHRAGGTEALPQVFGTCARYPADHHASTAGSDAGTRDDYSARRPAQRGWHQFGRGRGRCSGRQSHHPWLYRAERFVYRWNVRDFLAATTAIRSTCRRCKCCKVRLP